MPGVPLESPVLAYGYRFRLKRHQTDNHQIKAKQTTFKKIYEKRVDDGSGLQPSRPFAGGSWGIARGWCEGGTLVPGGRAAVFAVCAVLVVGADLRRRLRGMGRGSEDEDEDEDEDE
ncbi:MAG TPA: hypothetical protein VG347_21175, partial [Verrucomicrobiae bacterium]|nr:hypothetical protein [Verrucomicrobiae bacterium]